jgi:CubicO group peptidase (beta-lactamase class C family)
MAKVTKHLLIFRCMPLALVLTFGAVISAQPIPQAPGAEAAVREVRPAHPMRDFKGDPAYPDSYWGTATPGEARIDTAGLDAAVARIAEKGWEIHGMVVARNGKIVFERYGWKTGQNADDPDKSQHQVLPNERHLMHSTTKSITSALVGIALHEGLIPGGIEARAVSFFPEWQPLPDASPEKDSIRIVDLLTMRSGLRYQEGTDDQAIFFEPQSPAHAYLSRPVVGRPVGTKWNYSSAGSGVLAAILKKVTGKSPKRYAEEKLFTPLGIADPPWAAGKDGIQHGGWGLAGCTRGVGSGVHQGAQRDAMERAVRLPVVAAETGSRVLCDPWRVRAGHLRLPEARIGSCVHVGHEDQCGRRESGRADGGDHPAGSETVKGCEACRI